MDALSIVWPAGPVHHPALYLGSILDRVFHRALKEAGWISVAAGVAAFRVEARRGNGVALAAKTRAAPGSFISGGKAQRI